MANRSPSHYPDIGVLGEELVAQWLQSTGWIILRRRWRCRWGEIDIIARQQPVEDARGRRAGGFLGSSADVNSSRTQEFTRSERFPLLVFVEVKTRSRGNWDAGGLLSITTQKQAKLCQTAQCFLATCPHLIDYPCRFDAALVYCQRLSTRQNQNLSEVPITLEGSKTFQLGQAVSSSGYQLVLQEYIPSAFD